jgi:hypothetical protein
METICVEGAYLAVFQGVLCSVGLASEERWQQEWDKSFEWQLGQVPVDLVSILSSSYLIINYW